MTHFALRKSQRILAVTLSCLLTLVHVTDGGFIFPDAEEVKPVENETVDESKVILPNESNR